MATKIKIADLFELLHGVSPAQAVAHARPHMGNNGDLRVWVKGRQLNSAAFITSVIGEPCEEIWIDSDRLTRSGDVLFLTHGALGRSAIVLGGDGHLPNSSMSILRARGEENLGPALLAWLHTEPAKRAVQGAAGGISVPFISAASLRSITVPDLRSRVWKMAGNLFLDAAEHHSKTMEAAEARFAAMLVAIDEITR